MHKQTTFIITAAILLTAAVASALYTVNAVNAQSNSTGAGGANKTSAQSNSTGAGGATKPNANASKAVVTMTNPVTGVTIGKILKISPGGNTTNATK
ncbi:MAG: hypothetical protein JO327_12730 [Nitrososphaeraceae archaeon]|nr:hypothetical protein [Nitrososphaeraceae archaeon]MBV9668980.1 hypothetical protein [Nitrososphaeraceae archaeon]